MKIKRQSRALAKAAVAIMLVTALLPSAAGAQNARGYALMEASTGRLLYAEMPFYVPLAMQLFYRSYFVEGIFRVLSGQNLLLML